MRGKTKKRIRRMGVVLFLLYLALLIYFLFFAESYGRTNTERVYSYNLIPFLEIKRFFQYREQLGAVAFITNIFGNVLAFVPFGAILPVINRRTRSFLLIFLLSMEFSLMVETIQLIFKVGSFDVDDIILNTLGGVIGYLCFAFCNWIRRKLYV
ncbi:VanZ family protein [Murimonas intestini]|uniref:VanZ like protein n=1 Tax=Murimonas intestini TaxID=1337051 RepID=A0AB73SZ61_9FIRM|nr:VanZ family protein [Murimonas intestini]MCR1842869.1 VanZ family protein [Murimonas intestini]MCR1868166.1 VanZ family protein [Murimonas intestini]MCR1885342.1 VanZ family protein [Murimonas intestini]